MIKIRNIATGPNSTRALGMGLVAMVVFYCVIYLPIFRNTVLYSHTTKHITEFTIVGLFFWANSDLLLSWLATRRNAAGTAYPWIPERQGVEPPTNAASLLDGMSAGPKRLAQTMMARRLRSALRFVSERQSAEGFREYLNDLAERDSEEVVARYSFPKFVTALLPILGLLGTVVHFGSALSGLSASELTEKIPEIVSGMGTAFDTTCAALTASISTMLIRFLVERRDESILLKINGYMEDELLHRFTTITTTEADAPFIHALSKTQERTLAVIGSYEQRIALEWTRRMTQIHDMFEKADRQREDQLGLLIQSLDTLQRSYLAEVKEARTEFANASRLVIAVGESLNSDGHLQQLQEQLVQNLTLLRQSQQFEVAMHELTGAIHLLTARQSSVSKAA